MKKRLSYGAYLRSSWVLYFLLTVLVLFCNTRGAFKAFYFGEAAIENQRELAMEQVSFFGGWLKDMDGQEDDDAMEDIQREYTYWKKRLDMIVQVENKGAYYCQGMLGENGLALLIKREKIKVFDRNSIMEKNGAIAEYYYWDNAEFGCLFGIIIIILSQLRYGTGKSREFLIQLPIKSKLRYIYETANNAVIAIGIPVLIDIAVILVAVVKGYGYKDLLEIVVYMTVVSLFCFSFLTMFKEFHRNSFVGTLWGIAVLVMVYTGVEDIMVKYTNLGEGLLPMWFAFLLSIVFLLIGWYTAGSKRIEQTHAIRFLLVRVLMVLCFIEGNLMDVVEEASMNGFNVYGVVITVLWAIACYTLIDLSYISRWLERLLQSRSFSLHTSK